MLVPAFPRLLRPVWALSDPASRCDRRCDALDQLTAHQRLQTAHGPYWICSVTGQMHYDGPPDDLIAQTDDHYRKVLANPAAAPAEPAAYRRWVNDLAPHRQTGRLFEVGCGNGLFLQAAVQAGWRAEGNDMSAVAAEFARRHSGATVRAGLIEDLDLERAVYDVVICNNVFEHFAQPRRALAQLTAALRPGGVMFFETLNGQSLAVWARPIDWLYYGPAHLIVPTLVSLRHYFAHAGLRPVRHETHGYRTGAAEHYSGTRRWHRLGDKIMSGLAGRVGRGHRVRYLLQRG